MSRQRSYPHNDALREVIYAAERAGCTVQGQGRAPHAKLVLPDGRKLPFSMNRKQDGRAAKNMAAQLRRCGILL